MPLPDTARSICLFYTHCRTVPWHGHCHATAAPTVNLAEKLCRKKARNCQRTAPMPTHTTHTHTTPTHTRGRVGIWRAAWRIKFLCYLRHPGTVCGFGWSLVGAWRYPASPFLARTYISQSPCLPRALHTCRAYHMLWHASRTRCPHGGAFDSALFIPRRTGTCCLRRA